MRDRKIADSRRVHDAMSCADVLRQPQRDMWLFLLEVGVVEPAADEEHA
jgi:hypothetical protein